MVLPFYVRLKATPAGLPQAIAAIREALATTGHRSAAHIAGDTLQRLQSGTAASGSLPDPGFAEIQALRDAGVTTGCATAPARFCPDELLDGAAATALLTRAFPGATPPAMSDAPTETDLAAAITALGGAPQSTASVLVTRARAAVLIARGAGLAPRPL